MTLQILEGDCRDVLRGLPAKMVQTVVTSPPYFGLRDYGTGEWEGGDPSCSHAKVTDRVAAVASSTLDGSKATTGHVQEGYGQTCGRCGASRVDRQIGLEPTPDEFVAALVEVFREVRRVLRDDGTVWLNLGDSYSPNWSSQRGDRGGGGFVDNERARWTRLPGTKPKDLLGIPWAVAFALRADGWYLRSDIIWAKPNPMPESVTDRPTKAHEYLFLLSKGPRYFYDADAIREGAVSDHPSGNGYARPARQTYQNADGTPRGQSAPWIDVGGQRNRRSVWTVATQPYSGAHFATFPPKLIEPCILAGTSPKACGECGAPWRRMIVQADTEPDLSQRSTAHYNTADRYGAGNGGNGGLDALAAKMREGKHGTRTVGWEPSCAHQDDTGRCVVLDPFAGSGTTGVVAGQLQRDFVGRGTASGSRLAKPARLRDEHSGRSD